MVLRFAACPLPRPAFSRIVRATTPAAVLTGMSSSTSTMDSPLARGRGLPLLRAAARKTRWAFCQVKVGGLPPCPAALSILAVIASGSVVRSAAPAPTGTPTSMVRQFTGCG